MIASIKGARRSSRRKAQRLLMASALTPALFLGLGSVAAQAQGEAQASDDVIFVTGSRLGRRDLVAPSPITTIDQDQIRTSGNVTLEDTLNEFPQLAPDTTSSTNQSGGAGVLSANLRGLGAVRTLVLVDGRRFVPADETGLVDLATIPDILLQRVEVITGGASAVYGSDAIAGAVNFILRDDIQGLETRYTYGQSFEGDGATHNADLVFGTTLDDGRGSVVAHASYTSRDPIFMGDREFSRQPLLADSNGVLQNFGSGNIPGGLIGLNSALFDQINGVDLAGADCPGPVQGVRFGAGGEPLPFCRPTDQFNYADVNYLLRPLERWQVSTFGRYEITDNVEAYGQFFYTKKENSFQQAPEAVQPRSTGQEAGTLLIPNADTNPLFPEPLRNFFGANAAFFDPDNDGIYTVRNVGRRFEEFGPRNTSFTADSLNMTAGLRGTINLLDSPWQWDTFYQYQRADVDSFQTGRLSVSRTTLGLDVEVVDGVPQCRIDLLNCVPVNLFGTETLTPEMANFLSVSTGTRNEFTRQVAGGSLSGDLFELPAGPVASAFGVEYRKETFETNPDEVARSGDLTTVAPIFNQGEYDLFEVFGETRIPIINDAPLIQSFAIEGAVRYSDYSTIGGVVTWKVGGDWVINEYLRARASYNRAIRAPNLNELFGAPSLGFTGGIDPCVADNNPSEQQKDLCVAQGVPAAFRDSLEVGASQGFNVVSGGNQNLEEERSKTLTVGAVFSVPFIDGLDITADYYRIEVDGAVAQVAAQTLVDSCFQTLDADGIACQSISRLSDGNIDEVGAPLLNLASLEVSGVDVQATYGFDLPNFMALPNEGASMNFRLVTSWQFDSTTTPLAGEAEIECAGFFGGPCSSDSVRLTPDFRAFFTASWESGPVSLRTEVQYIGDFELSPLGFQLADDELEPEVYVDLIGAVRPTEGVELFAGINNLLDNGPPVIGFRAGGDSNTNPQLYDVVGRRFFVGAALKF